MDLTEFVVSVVFGVVTSLTATRVWDRWSRPSLNMVVDMGRASGPMWEFFHVVISNRRVGPGDDLWPGIRPA